MKPVRILLILVSLAVFSLTGCGKKGSPAVDLPQATEPVHSGMEASQPSGLKPVSDVVEEPGASGSLQPNGLAVDTGDGIGLSFYGLDGLSLGEVRLPQPAWLSKNLLHLAGANQGDPTSIAIIYFRGSQNPDDEDAGLRSLSQGQASLLLKSRDSEGLVGVPGKDLLAFVERTPMIESGLLRSSLFLGSSTSLAGADPVLVVDSQESLGIVPIAIRMDGEAAVGVWYTQRPYGIGGEILFDPLGGLWFLDLTTSTSSEVLSNSQSLLGFSPSQQWLAAGGRGPDQPDFQLVDLVSQEARSIQIKPENDRGAGMVVF